MDPKLLLLKHLKKAGLNIGEDAVVGVVEAVFNALPEFLLATENKVDDLAISLLPIIKPHILAALDKIDGEIDFKKEE